MPKGSFFSEIHRLFTKNRLAAVFVTCRQSINLYKQLLPSRLYVVTPPSKREANQGSLPEAAKLKRGSE